MVLEQPLEGKLAEARQVWRVPAELDDATLAALVVLASTPLGRWLLAHILQSALSSLPMIEQDAVADGCPPPDLPPETVHSLAEITNALWVQP